MKTLKVSVKDYSFEKKSLSLGDKNGRVQITLPLPHSFKSTTTDLFNNQSIVSCNYSQQALRNHCERLKLSRIERGYHLSHTFLEYYVERGIFGMLTWVNDQLEIEDRDILSVPISIGMSIVCDSQILIDADLFERIQSRELSLEKGRITFKDKALPNLNHVCTAELNDLLIAHRRIGDRANVRFIMKELKGRATGLLG